MNFSLRGAFFVTLCNNLRYLLKSFILRTFFSFSAYVIFLAIMVSLTGLVMEPLMIAGISQLNPGYIKSWMAMTAFCFIFSLMLALCFILHNIHVIRIGKLIFYSSYLNYRMKEFWMRFLLQNFSKIFKLTSFPKKNPLIIALFQWKIKICPGIFTSGINNLTAMGYQGFMKFPN